MKLDVKTNGAMTSQGVPINTDGVAVIYNDRESFGAKVHEVAGTDLSEMGLEIKTSEAKRIGETASIEAQTAIAEAEKKNDPFSLL